MWIVFIFHSDKVEANSYVHFIGISLGRCIQFLLTPSEGYYLETPG